MRFRINLKEINSRIEKIQYGFLFAADVEVIYLHLCYINVK
jgi:hypothetical protein